MDETVHDLLLRLAGRVDDDLLADARELVAVGEDGHALELVTAALAADRAPLPSALRADIVAAAHEARIDLDADAALAPAGTDPTEHRFSAWAERGGVDAAVPDAVRNLPGRLLTGVRLRLAWRWTPAGSAPTPLPCPVLLVQTGEGGRPGEVLAYQMHEGLRRSGVLAAVEVLTSGRPLTTYHAAALRDSIEVEVEATDPQAVVEPVPPSAEEHAAESPPLAPVRSAARARADERPDNLFGDDQPAPRPVPMRSWQSGRRRRAFTESVEDASPPDEPPAAVDAAEVIDGAGESAVAPTMNALPSPVPLARRRAAPTAWSATPFGASTAADPLVGPLDQPLLDPVLDSVPEQAPSASAGATDDGAWAGEWTSESWGVTEPTRRSGTPPLPVEADPIPDADADADRPSAGEVETPVDDPAVEPGALLKPESVARLNDADRHLLARLQAELQAEQADRTPPHGQRAGAHALRTADDEAG